MARVIFAIIVAWLTTILLSMGTDMAMVKVGVFPAINSAQLNLENNLLVIASVCHGIYVVLGVIIMATAYIKGECKLPRKYLHRYSVEFEYRYNSREKLDYEKVYRYDKEISKNHITIH